MQIFGAGGKADQVVADYMNGSADIIGLKPGEVQRFREDPLPGKGSIAVQLDGQIFCAAGVMVAGLLGAGAAEHDRVNRLKVAGI